MPQVSIVLCQWVAERLWLPFNFSPRKVDPPFNYPGGQSCCADHHKCFKTYHHLAWVVPEIVCVDFLHLFFYVTQIILLYCALLFSYPPSVLFLADKKARLSAKLPCLLPTLRSDHRRLLAEKTQLFLFSSVFRVENLTRNPQARNCCSMHANLWATCLIIIRSTWRQEDFSTYTMPTVMATCTNWGRRTASCLVVHVPPTPGHIYVGLIFQFFTYSWDSEWHTLVNGIYERHERWQ